MNKRCVIVSAGDFFPSDYTPKPGDFIIAADGGYTYLKNMGITPSVCIGDFDSLGFTPADCPTIPLAVEKDCTDTDAAIRQGLAAGCTEFLLLGMLGGSRLSHTVANLQTLTVLAKKHIPHKILGAGTTVRALAKGDTLRFPKNESLHVSVLAITDTATVTIKGLHYEGENISLSNRFPLAVSNSTEGKDALVRCENGMIWIITEEK